MIFWTLNLYSAYFLQTYVYERNVFIAVAVHAVIIYSKKNINVL